ncbi:MAG: hypothetical protein LBO69_06845 [Ignavibacteria bacterium]|jgi:hypothetical protein|nr:hypothetical protein [Ignavibacteria bacterium]
MFDDDIIKFESQILIIDTLIYTIDKVVAVINKHNLRTDDLSVLVSRIFLFCNSIIELIPNYVLVSNSKRKQLLNSISIVHSYWDDDDIDMFSLNWSLFVAQWGNFAESIKNKNSMESLHFISLN